MPSQKKKLPAFSIQSVMFTSERDQIRWISALKTLLEGKHSIEKRLREILNAIPYLYESGRMDLPTVEECEQKIRELQERAAEAEPDEGKYEPTQEEVETLLKSVIEPLSQEPNPPGRPASEFNVEVWRLKMKNPRWRKSQIASEMAGKPEFADEYRKNAERRNEVAPDRPEIARQMQSRVAKAWNDPRQKYLPPPNPSKK